MGTWKPFNEYEKGITTELVTAGHSMTNIYKVLNRNRKWYNHTVRMKRVTEKVKYKWTEIDIIRKTHCTELSANEIKKDLSLRISTKSV